MKGLSNKKLLAYNRQGFIPGPRETEEEFLARTKTFLNFDKEHQLRSFPFSDSVYTKTRQLFDIEPDWAPIVFSGKSLTPWTGACTWFICFDEESPPLVLIQLSQRLEEKTQYCGYHRDELIAHETAHLARTTFEEPRFEEILAYQSSPRWWRRYWGPLVQSTWKIVLFFLCLVLAIATDIIAVIANAPTLSVVGTWLKGGLALTLLGNIGWLVFKQHLFRRCKRKIQQMLGEGQAANGLLFRLTDEEIVMMGKMTPQQIHQWAQEQAKYSLRWKVLVLEYLASDVQR